MFRYFVEKTLGLRLGKNLSSTASALASLIYRTYFYVTYLTYPVVSLASRHAFVRQTDSALCRSYYLFMCDFFNVPTYRINDGYVMQVGLGRYLLDQFIWELYLRISPDHSDWVNIN